MNLEDKICSICGEIMGTTIADLDKSAMVVFQCVNPYCFANKKVKDNSSFLKKEKEFEILIENLSIAYNQFCLNRVIHEKVGDNFYRNFNRTWNIILWGLEMSYLLGLAKFLINRKIFPFIDF